jgi:hypothetical protein
MLKHVITLLKNPKKQERVLSLILVLSFKLAWTKAATCIAENELAPVGIFSCNENIEEEHKFLLSTAYSSVEQSQESEQITSYSIIDKLDGSSHPVESIDPSPSLRFRDILRIPRKTANKQTREVTSKQEAVTITSPEFIATVRSKWAADTSGFFGKYSDADRMKKTDQKKKTLPQKQVITRPMSIKSVAFVLLNIVVNNLSNLVSGFNFGKGKKVIPWKLYSGSRLEAIRVWKMRILTCDFIFSPVPKTKGFALFLCMVTRN